MFGVKWEFLCLFFFAFFFDKNIPRFSYSCGIFLRICITKNAARRGMKMDERNSQNPWFSLRTLDDTKRTAKKGNLPLMFLGLFIVLRFFSDRLSSFQMHTQDRVFCLEIIYIFWFEKISRLMGISNFFIILHII